MHEKKQKNDSLKKNGSRAVTNSKHTGVSEHPLTGLVERVILLLDYTPSHTRRPHTTRAGSCGRCGEPKPCEADAIPPATVPRRSRMDRTGARHRQLGPEGARQLKGGVGAGVAHLQQEESAGWPGQRGQGWQARGLAGTWMGRLEARGSRGVGGGIREDIGQCARLSLEVDSSTTSEASFSPGSKSRRKGSVSLRASVAGCVLAAADAPPAGPLARALALWAPGSPRARRASASASYRTAQAVITDMI